MLKGFKFLGKFVFGLNVLLAIATLIGYAAPLINPTNFWPVAFFGLALPYFLILNFFFVIFWIFRGSSRIFLSLIILFLAYKTVPKFAQLRLSGNEENVEETVKVLSFNVRVFDLYMWTKEKTTRNKIFEFLEEEQAHILCLQEFYNTDIPNPKYNFKTLDTLVQFLESKNYHTYYTTTLRENDHWGLVTFSKYPIVGRGLVNFKEKDDNACIYTDIEIKNKTIRVYNTHLASIKLDKRDYKAMQEINQNQYSEDFGDEMMMVNKIKYGFKRRAQQADSIRKSLDQSPFPTILCGDFNDTPSSYAYGQIKGEFQDAFMKAGSGLGRTYIGEFPSFRIDYIFMDDNFEVKDFDTHSEKLSDHHPISAKFLLK